MNNLRAVGAVKGNGIRDVLVFGPSPRYASLDCYYRDCSGNTSNSSASKILRTRHSPTGSGTVRATAHLKNLRSLEGLFLRTSMRPISYPFRISSKPGSRPNIRPRARRDALLDAGIPQPHLFRATTGCNGRKYQTNIVDGGERTRIKPESAISRRFWKPLMIAVIQAR